MFELKFQFLKEKKNRFESCKSLLSRDKSEEKNLRIANKNNNKPN